MTAPLKPLIPHVGLQLKLWQNGHGCSNARLIITAKTACVDGHSVAADDHVVGVADFLVVPCWMRWRGGEEGGWGLVGAGGGGGGGIRDEPELPPAWPRLLCRAVSSTNACGPVNTEQTYRHRGTGENTATGTRRTRALCTASHLRSVRSGPWGGSGFGGEADPEVCQYLWCHNTNLRGEGGGGDVGRGQFRHPRILVPCGRLQEISAHPNFCGTIDAKSARPEVGSPY